MNHADVISCYYTAFNADDAEGMLELLTDDVVHDINQGARQTGKEVFRDFLCHMDHCYRERVVDLVVFANGDRGAAEFVIEGEYLRTDEGLPEARGQRYRLPVGAFFSFENGRIARVTNYYNLQDWIDQVSR
ncbi:MAG TPA: ketosteroid isomerase-related protein [Pseudomonadales bacterium]|nr:ketosteroid isomerase-related protein [Pseudomonadales bacterium]